MKTIVDVIANVMPLAGSAIPAVMTYESVQRLGFEPWQSFVIAGVVEALGFVTVTTSVDIYEANQDQGVDQNDKIFLVSLVASLIYATVMVLINAVLHEGPLETKLVLALLSLFGLLGGLMVALRNQLGKRLVAFAAKQQEQKKKEEQDKEEANRQAREQNHRDWVAQQEREKQERENAQKLAEQKLAFEHEFKLRKLAEKAQKLSETFQTPQESFQKVSEPAEKLPETFNQFQDWRKVPESERKIIATFQTPEQVQERYGGSLKTCGNWLANAKKEFPKGDHSA